MAVPARRPVPIAEFSREDISPFFWINGKMPTCEEWKTLAASDFQGYRLKVYGQVENPVELSLDDLRALGRRPRSRCITASRAGRASPSGADFRWRNW